MKLAREINQYEETFSNWAGCTVRLSDDFDVFCDCDFDFIEILMSFEKEFSLNLLESTRVRQEFGKVSDFIAWVDSRPSSEDFYSFRFYEPETLCMTESWALEEVS